MAMTPKTIAAMLRKLRAEQDKLAKNRDELRELLSAFESVADDASDAVESLEYAIEALSRLQ